MPVSFLCGVQAVVLKVRCQSLGHLVLQRKRADCGIASPVIAALCGQNANRQSEQERGGDGDYALGHHGSPLGFEVTLHA